MKVLEFKEIIKVFGFVILGIGITYLTLMTGPFGFIVLVGLILGLLLYLTFMISTKRTKIGD